jgi:glycosyltransferase involved in cell wall biosynthesis
LDLQDYDLIISSTTSFAKAVQKRPGAKHICFCHNVTRFLWDTNTYLRDYSTYRNISAMLGPIFREMRKADLASAQGPDFYIANSSTVADRIKLFYEKESVVINYPIDIKKFVFSKDKEDFYLASARILGYKRFDIIVEAFNWLGWPLLITGDGPEREKLEKKALKNIKFLGHVSDDKRSRLMSKARGVIVAALEDYGLVPVEANASGTPVISYGKGGVLDTQIPGKTGVFFNQQTPGSLQEALYESREIAWDHEKIRDHAISNFSEDAFFKKVDVVIEEVCGYRQP